VFDEMVGAEPLPLIDQILTRNNLELKDLEEVDSNPGPGSFTGLKIGAAIANVLNFLLGNKKRIKPIYSAKDTKQPS
jgi:tRNA A37 threonylcarbamoyladenosine modification protein TsaB